MIYDISQGVLATGFMSGDTSDCECITNLLLSLL